MTIFKKVLLLFLLCIPFSVIAQINTDRVMLMGRNALYYEDYVLSIQRFNMVIGAKPYLAEPYFYRALAKFYLEDYWGAETDCSEAIERNPFLPDNYRLRGLCRINLKNYGGAVDDYKELLNIEPKEQNAWHNMTLCYIELKDYEHAMESVDMMIKNWPKVGKNYVIKAQTCFLMKDTVEAMNALDEALKINEYDGDAWQMKAMVYTAHEEYEKAEEAMDKTILQSPREAAHYINRALIRYHRMNLRGAMADYDTAIEFDPNSYVGHFNRGLLRAQVGDDNRAIEDFNYVLKVEPDNMIALFNRALMLDNTGDYRGAIRDISKVISENPNFIDGYQYRAQIRRKIGDINGAERDEFKVLKAQVEKKPISRNGTKKTRKQSDRTMEDYDKLVEADTEETSPQYGSEYRGRVQNRKTELRPEPAYVLTYYPKEQNFKQINYNKDVEQLNRSNLLPKKLELTNYEAVPTVEEMDWHTAHMNKLTENLRTQPDNPSLYFARALDEYVLQNSEQAVADVDKALALDSTLVLARFFKTQLKIRELEMKEASRQMDLSGNKHEKQSDHINLTLACRAILEDCEAIMAERPDFLCCEYNIGNLYLMMQDYEHAITSYSHVIQTDNRFACAYYNRGLAYILSGRNAEGVKDLSRAGELGLYSAYNLMKRYGQESNKKDSSGE